MNERYKEIAEIARRFPIGGSWTYRHFGDFEQEFARQLIAECVKIVGEVQPGYRDYRSQIEEVMRDDCVAAIKHHFGIE